MTNNTLPSSRIVIVGAGNMGSGIAQKYATHGHLVTVIDKSDENLFKSQQAIEHSLAQAVKRQIASPEDAQATRARLNFSHDLDSCRHADVVIEAIFENLALKRELFSHLDVICPQETLLATNTSSLMVADLQRGLKHPERVLGLHYFFPPAKNRLVEIIRAKQTSDHALSYAERLQKSINKTAIHSQDAPGFIVNRFFVPWLNESLRIVHEGLASIAEVEAAACRFFQIGMGPFALMNATGLPITFHSCQALARSLGDFYAPCPLIIPHIEKHTQWDLSGDVDETNFREISLRLASIVSIVACQIVSDQIGSQKDIDCGAQIGLMWKQGPLALLDEHFHDVVKHIEHMNKNGQLLPDTGAFAAYVQSRG